MRARAPAMIAALLATSVSVGTLQVQYRDASGSMAISGLDSWRLTKVDDRTYSFRGRGAPIRGNWTTQRFTIVGNEVSGTLLEARPRAYSLSAATITGSASFEAESTNQRGNTQTTNVASNTVVYTGKSNLVTTPGALDLRIQTPAEGQLFTAKASKSTMELASNPNNAGFPLKSAALEGPVTMTMKWRRVPTASELKEKPGLRFIVVSVDGRADRLVFDDEKREIVLTGNVFFEGSDSSAFGSVRASKATVRLNDKREIVETEFEGAPGETQIGQKKPNP